MKKIIYVILLLSILSCEKDLGVSPQSIITKNTMWKSSEDALGAMYGMFSQLRAAMDKEFIYWGGYRSGFFGDALVSQANFQDMFDNTLDAEDTGTNWAPLYTTINDCNLILKYVPEIEFQDLELKDEILANSYFVRSFCYYYIARVWGDAPVLTSGFESDNQEDLYPSRQPVSVVLQQVEMDVNKAIELFGDEGFSIKIGSKAAANMLKADYNLWMAKTQDGGLEALEEAKKSVMYVLNSTDFVLSISFEDIFRNDENEELIFSLEFEMNEATGGFATDWLVAIQYVNDKSLIENPIKVGSHTQWVCFTPEYEAFLFENPDDQRAGVSLDSYYEEGNQNFRWINKYLGDWIDNTRFWTSDIKIYRFAEALLFMAEIENALGNTSEALKYLNQIAFRAYGQKDFYSGNISQEELDQIILNERLKEFSAEGKSWWDLIRFGVVFDRVNTLQGRENEENILFWPVNSNSLNSNSNITQTSGY